MLITPWPDQKGNKLVSLSGTRAISTTSSRELSSSPPLPSQGKAPKEIHAIPTETLACFLPGRAKDLSAHLYLLFFFVGLYSFNKVFLLAFGKLHFKLSSATRSKCLTELYNAHSQVTNRGPTWILYMLLVVDENGYDLFPPEE